MNKNKSTPTTNPLHHLFPKHLLLSHITVKLHIPSIKVWEQSKHSVTTSLGVQ